MSKDLDDILRASAPEVPSPSPDKRVAIRGRLIELRNSLAASGGRLHFRVPRRTIAMVAAGVVVAGLSGAVIEQQFWSEDEGGTPVTDVQGSKLISEETPQDVVTWADQVVVASVIHETEVAGDTEVSSGGDGMVNRLLTIRVDETVWTRQHGDRVGKTFEALDWGWAVRDGVRSEAVVEGTPRFEVGQQYVLAVAKMGPEWVILGEASFPIDSGVAEPVRGQDTPLAKLVNGRSATAIAQILTRTPPQAEAVGHLDLPLLERVEAVNKEKKK